MAGDLASNNDAPTYAAFASVGTVTYDNTSPLDILLRQADQAMYREKRARRAQPEPSNDISGP